MRHYLISFRILKNKKDGETLKIVKDALDISYKRAQRLVQLAAANDDIKIQVTAEQLGNLQAARIINNYCDYIRYLCECEEIVDNKPTKIIELRPGMRTIEVPSNDY